jgi:hypothetical protein
MGGCCMGRFTREEIEEQWAHYQKVARRCGPAGDWDEFVDLYTEDATMVVSGAGRIGGREAMRRWYREAFGTQPMRSLVYYPVEWYMIDEERGWVSCQFWNRMADPGDGSIHEFSCFSLLKYAGDGQWSYEEDKLDPGEMQSVLEGWYAAKQRLGTMDDA